MLRHACNPPRVNAESIVNQGLPWLGLTGGGNTVDQFGITVDTNMLVIPARELPPPTVTYRPGAGAGRPPDVRNGSWHTLDVKFTRGAHFSSWWVLAVRDGQLKLTGPQDPALRGLVQAFASKCSRSGMGVPPGLPKLLWTPDLPQEQDPGRKNALSMI